MKDKLKNLRAEMTYATGELSMLLLMSEEYMSNYIWWRSEQHELLSCVRRATIKVLESVFQHVIDEAFVTAGFPFSSFW